MAKTSPTQRSLKMLRDDGYIAAITEKWNPYAKVRQDLYGFIDLVAIRSDVNGVVGVQTTSYSNMAKREQKIQESDAAAVWLQAGNRIVVHGWHKKGNRWVVRELELEYSGGVITRCSHPVPPQAPAPDPVPGRS